MIWFIHTVNRRSPKRVGRRDFIRGYRAAGTAYSAIIVSKLISATGFVRCTSRGANCFIRTTANSGTREIKVAPGFAPPTTETRFSFFDPTALVSWLDSKRRGTRRRGPRRRCVAVARPRRRPFCASETPYPGRSGRSFPFAALSSPRFVFSTVSIRSGAE